jgi:calcineurin-like phosphoesterase family protein
MELLNIMRQENNFSVSKQKSGKYLVFTISTFYFEIDTIDELTEERFLLQKEIFNERQREMALWSENYWTKIKQLEKDDILPNEKVWFTADLHFGHPNIIEHSNRPFADATEMDAYWLEKWNDTVDKKDRIYILGDFYWKNKNACKDLLNKLKGNKYCILGNHDSAIQGENERFFESISDTKFVRFKREQYPYIEEFEFGVFMSHYPHVSWLQKHRNSIMIHGHCHGNIDNYNANSSDIRVDIGIDGVLSKQCGGFIDLEHLYEFYYHKRYYTGNLMQNP